MAVRLAAGSTKNTRPPYPLLEVLHKHPKDSLPEQCWHAANVAYNYNRAANLLTVRWLGRFIEGEHDDRDHTWC